jgi:Rieske 2Fe-2S family protein
MSAMAQNGGAMTRRTHAPIDAAALDAVLAPFGESHMLPRVAYIDDGVLTWEQGAFFQEGWVCAGRTADVADPGDQQARSVGGAGLLMVRDSGGALHTFANACRHRGHELLPCDATSNRGVIQCPYHAWSYELDGRLRLAPRFDAGNFDPSTVALIPVRNAEWGGWVFVNVSGDAPPFAQHLGSLADALGNWECDRLVVAHTHRYELAANWKIAIENYNECYHCPLIHPELARVSPPESGDNHEGRGAWVGGSMNLADFAATMSLTGRSDGVAMRNLTPEQRRQVLYFAVFPNLLVSLHPDYVLTHRLEPLAAGRTNVECQWLFPPEAIETPGFDPSYAVDFWDLTNHQDWAAVESVQRGVSHPAFVPGVLAEQESDVYRFVTMVARGYRGEPITGGPSPRRSPAAGSAPS